MTPRSRAHIDQVAVDRDFWNIVLDAFAPTPGSDARRVIRRMRDE